MTFDTPFPGKAKTVKTKLTANTVTTIYTVGAGAPVLKGVNVADISGSGDTIDIIVTNGGTDYYLAKNKAVAANSAWAYDGPEIPLVSGDVVKVKAANANRLDVFAVFVENFDKQG